MYYSFKIMIFCFISLMITITNSEFVIDSHISESSQYISINEFNTPDVKCKEDINDMIESNNVSEKKKVLKKKDKIISISNSEEDSHSWDF